MGCVRGTGDCHEVPQRYQAPRVRRKEPVSRMDTFVRRRPAPKRSGRLRRGMAKASARMTMGAQLTTPMKVWP